MFVQFSLLYIEGLMDDKLLTNCELCLRDLSEIACRMRQGPICRFNAAGMKDFYINHSVYYNRLDQTEHKYRRYVYIRFGIRISFEPNLSGLFRGYLYVRGKITPPIQPRVKHVGILIEI